MYSEQSRTIYSKACGKVLIAGGYGVLERQNIGLTLAVQNFFYCKLEHQQSTNFSEITLESPQINSKYHYTFNSETKRLQQTRFKQNLFVESALYFSLKYFNLLENWGKFKIALIFDKGFISQLKPSNSSQKFAFYPQNYSKTGLGSSACVVVSIVSAICAFMKEKQNKILINVISQVANLWAQKKIGSNFDISTAVFGTHLYKNILPEMAFQCSIQSCWQDLVKIDPKIKRLQVINKVIKDYSIGYLIDVSKGTNTRAMVSSFVKSLRLLSSQIQQQFFLKNKFLVNQFYQMFKSDDEQTLQNIKRANCKYRQFQQKYSEFTKTPVEPKQFQNFMDDLMANEDIFYVICPGSGGYDALFMLASSKKPQQYYQSLIEKISRTHQKQLGQDVSFRVKIADIKWDDCMQVSFKQITEIQQFLASLQIIK